MRCEWMATRYDHSTERSTSRNAHHYYDNGKSTDNDAFVYHQTNNRSSSMNNKQQQRRSDDNSKYRQSRTTHESDRLKEKSNVQTGVRLKEFGDWSEQNSSSGKRYFYNRQTEVSQWDKPKEWRDYERTLLEKSTNARSPSIGSSSATPSWNTPQVAVAATSSTSNNHHGGYSTAAESPHDHRRAPTPNGAVLQYDASTSSHHQSNRGGANLKRDRTNDSPISDLSKRRKTPHYNSYHQPSTSADYDGNVDNRRGDANFGATSRNDTYRLHGGADVAAGSQGHRHDSRIVDQQQEAWKNTVSSIDSSPMKVARQSGDNSTVVSASNPTQFAITAVSPSTSSAGGASSREPNDVKQQISCDNELQLPMLPPLSAEHMRYYNGESARHSTGWASEHFDAQANVHSIAAINISLRLGDVSADLKCARSLVRTAEIRSTLLRQKLLFVAQQQRQLAAALSSSKPPSSTI